MARSRQARGWLECRGWLLANAVSSGMMGLLLLFGRTRHPLLAVAMLAICAGHVAMYLVQPRVRRVRERRTRARTGNGL